MKNKRALLFAGFAMSAILCSLSMVRAQLSKPVRAAVKKMISGTLYLRVQAPQKYGVGAWAPYSESMLDASPTGVSADRRLAEPLKNIPKNGYHLKTEEIYWGYLANTPVKNCKLVSERGILVVWCERVSPNTDVSVDFIGINTLDDFSQAFDLIFSETPLQEEHPDWPANVRSAIASGKLVVGMTAEQARIVVGAPLNITQGEDSGVKTETWTLRQDPGQVLGWSTKLGAHMQVAKQTGFPASITFKDGKLVSIKWV